MQQARRSASRENDNATSKPVQGRRGNAASQSPSRRVTRLTRSQSRDPDAVSERLSTVPEIAKTTQLPVVVENAEEPDDDYEGLPSKENSGISGTTAISSRSQQELADLNVTAIVDGLPYLHREAEELLRFMTKDTSESGVQALRKELNKPGSVTSRRMAKYEENFKNQQKHYGSDTLINVGLIARKLFNGEDPGIGDFRPEAVFHTANLAAQLNELILADQESTTTLSLLQSLNDAFPKPFTAIPGYESQVDAMSEATIELALDIRSQTTIAMLAALKEQEDYDPDIILAGMFYFPPEARNQSLSPFDDYTDNGTIRPIADLSSTSESAERLEEIAEMIYDASQRIRTCFAAERDAIDDGEIVDFDQLKESFPWTAFLSHFAQWTSTRLDELRAAIENQDGVQNIYEQLEKQLLTIDSQASGTVTPPATPPILQATIEAPEAQKLKSPIKIVPASGLGKSLSTRGNVSIMKSIKRNMPTSAPPDTTIIRSEDEHFQPVNFDDDEISLESLPDTEKQAAFSASMKENLLPGPSSNQGPRTLLDRQADAEKVTWDSQNDVDSPSRQLQLQSRRTELHEGEASEEEVSEDEGFQEDRRPANEQRRAEMRPGRAPVRKMQPTQSSEPAASSSKRPRVHSEDESVEVMLPRKQRRPQQPEQEVREISRRDRNAWTDDENDHGNPPSSIYATVKELARSAPSVKTQLRPQTRTPWSVQDSEVLLNAIEHYGAHWATIVTTCDRRFERSIDQVALKDKARNMKVDFLIAGTALPQNFDAVTLGKKEINKIIDKGRNPYRKEGELPGRESVPMPEGHI